MGNCIVERSCQVHNFAQMGIPRFPRLIASNTSMLPGALSEKVT